MDGPSRRSLRWPLFAQRRRLRQRPFFSSINGFGGATYSSTDAITWTAIPAAATPGGGRIETGNGLVLLSNNTSRLRSTDGTTFTTYTPRTSAAALILGGNERFINERFIASGSDISAGTLRPVRLFSSDALNWSPLGNEATSPPPAAGTNRLYGYTDIAFGNGKYVLVGSDVIFAAGGNTYLPLITVLDASLVPAPPAVPVAPAITNPPVATAAVVGRSTTLYVVATGTGNTYQWRKDTGPGGSYVAIAGATAALYTIPTVTATSAGNYTVVITNTVGTKTSDPIALTLVTAEKAGRLINLSVLTDIASATDEFTLGYVVGGAATTGSKPLVIRAAGPSLGALGVPGTLADPKLETFAGATKTGENDNWGGSTELTGALAAVGAFAYTGPTSKDAAVSANISTRDNSVRVTGVAGATGAVIAEVYDATSSASFSPATPRLLNVSVRKNLGAGVTAGFVLGGTTPTRLLIRVVGPGLGAFGVAGTVVDPQLTLFAGSTKIAENNDWGGTAELAAASTSVGAFALPAATSKDAALLVSLPPGQYSVLANGVNNTTGVAIVEVYELP